MSQPGDFDGDGDVDIDDLTDPVEGWEARFGEDLNGSDFLAWQRNFSVSTGLAGSVAVVPEPGSVALVLISMTTISTGRWSRSRFHKSSRRVTSGGSF